MRSSFAFKFSAMLFIAFFITIFSIQAQDDGWETTEQTDQTPQVDTTFLETKAIAAYQDSLTIASIEGKLGVINDTGGVVLPFQYDKIDFFSDNDSSCSRWEGVLLVLSRGKYGLVDATGKPVTALYDKIEFMDETCHSASNKTKVVRVHEKGKQGLADAFGSVVIRPAYDQIYFLTQKVKLYDSTVIRPIQPELIIAQKSGKYGLFDLKNNVPLLRSEYDAIEHLQALTIKERKETHRTHAVRMRKGNLWGVLFLHNQSAIAPQYEYIGTFEGKESENMLALVQQKGKWGWIDLTGKEIIKISYDAAEPFRKELALVRKGSNWGAIDKNGKTVLKSSYEELKFLTDENEKNAFFKKLILAKDKGKWGVIDLEGKILVALDFDKLTFLPEKFGFMAEKNGKEEFVLIKN